MPASAEQLFFEGNRHLAAHDAARALACYQRAIAIAPGLAEAHANLAWLLAESGAFDEAVAAYQRAQEAGAPQVQISLNHGALLARLKRFDEAEAVYLSAIAVDPLSAPLWSHLGVLYAQAARLGEAEVCCREGLRLAPDYAKAHVNLAYLCLRQGRLEEGWAHYEWRGWRCALETHVDCPRWEGQPVAGKSLLIGHEGGYGDMIHFSRYAAVLKLRGARRVTLICPPELQTLLAAADGVDEVLASDSALTRHGWDFWASLMSLPHLCETRMDSIPATLPYVHADRGSVARLKPALPAHGMRVGLVWKGNPKFENDDERSLPSIDLLAPLAGVAGVSFIGLQTGAQEEVPAAFASKLMQLGNAIETFADTAAIVDTLDLVICVDTAVAHLAGALSKPCWLLLPKHLPDWRWLDERPNSPWYPGVMRLFRQATRGDWAPVIESVRVELERYVRGRGAPQYCADALVEPQAVERDDRLPAPNPPPVTFSARDRTDQAG